MADITAEELEKLEQEFRAVTCNIKESKEIVNPEELFKELLDGIILQQIYPLWRRPTRLLIMPIKVRCVSQESLILCIRFVLQ